jgi:transposase-like protein
MARCDETYILVGGRWMYLYRAVDEHGQTVESLSRTRDITAAKAFFRKALKNHGEPRSITLDGFEPSHAALRRMGMRNEFNFRWANPVKIRSCQFRKFARACRTQNCCQGASLGHDAGIDPKVAADQRGHGIGVAIDVYTKAALPRRAEAA